jgi:hypothetical protein
MSPGKGQVDGFTHSYFAKANKEGVRYFRCRIQKGEKSGKEKPKPMPAKKQGTNGCTNQAKNEKNLMKLSVGEVPVQFKGMVWPGRRKVPVKIIAADGAEKNKKV